MCLLHKDDSGLRVVGKASVDRAWGTMYTLLGDETERQIYGTFLYV